MLGRLQQAVDLGGEGFRIAAAAVLQIGLQSASGGHALDRGRVEGGDETIGLPHGAEPLQCLGQGEGVLALTLALAPGLQGEEAHPPVADDGTRQNVKAGEGHHVLHMRVGHGDLVVLIGHRLGASQGGGIRQHDGGEQVTLIFVGHQLPRHLHQQAVDGDQDHRDDGERHPDPAVEEGHPAYVAGGEAVEHPVEPDEEAGGFMMALFEQDGAQGWRQGQGYQTRDGDRDGDGDGELLVHHPRHAAHESDRQEDGAEHQHYGHHRA
ncbi:hypothetical protein D3C79_525780 [compost metagenome]